MISFKESAAKETQNELTSLQERIEKAPSTFITELNSDATQSSITKLPKKALGVFSNLIVEKVSRRNKLSAFKAFLENENIKIALTRDSKLSNVPAYRKPDLTMLAELATRHMPPEHQVEAFNTLMNNEATKEMLNAFPDASADVLTESLINLKSVEDRRICKELIQDHFSRNPAGNTPTTHEELAQEL